MTLLSLSTLIPASPETATITRGDRQVVITASVIRALAAAGERAELEQLGYTLGERTPAPEGKVTVASHYERQGDRIVEVHDELADAPEPELRTYKSDIWRRATDEEAAAIDAMLTQQPVRLRRLWEDSSYLLHTDELWPLIETAAVQAFGEARAAELLAPSE